MRQISYLTMAFLPASFAAVSVRFSYKYALSSKGLIFHSSEFLRHERQRTHTRHQRHAHELFGVRLTPHRAHCLDRHIFPLQRCPSGSDERTQTPCMACVLG